MCGDVQYKLSQRGFLHVLTHSLLATVIHVNLYCFKEGDTLFKNE